MVRFQGVHLRAGQTRILRDLNFDVERGEVLVLLGRSGSGKTSALRMVNRMLAPSQGTVAVDGKPTSDWDPILLRRRTGYVIQETGLFPHLSVEKNIGLIPKLEGWPQIRIRDRIAELMTLVGLDPAQYAHRMPSQLSGGQRQRVGIARALAADPPLLLFDEPFGALDPVTRHDLQNQFLQLQSSLNKTALFVTHDVREAMRIANRIALLEHGHLVFLGAPQEFRNATHPEARAFRSALESN
jgi:osmoprotectant transport system ATP-binding protein